MIIHWFFERIMLHSRNPYFFFIKSIVYSTQPFLFLCPTTKNQLYQTTNYSTIFRKINYSAKSISFFFRGSHTDSTEDSSALLETCYSKNLYIHPGIGQSVLLIQPRIKYGKDSEKKCRSELKLEEAISLVDTLPHWKVADKIILPVSDIHSKYLFGKGNLEKIKLMIHSSPNSKKITAVFIGINILKGKQGAALEAFFKVQVYDRYQVILQIFHDHAHTKEAKLQLALAEIPYLRVKLASFYHTRNVETFQGIEHVGGSGETYHELRKRLLNEREMKLKKELEKVRAQREFLRQREYRDALPIIAIVGYTNCGKTTLIRSLTDDTRLKPENKLFATLDVTLHQGLLPSNQKVLFIDTVGFISDVPTALIQSFRSTLEEINLADLVIHVRDISHPDAEMQKQTVLKTLQELNLPAKLIDSVLEVNNKIDLLENPLTDEDSNAISISATEGTGLPNLLECIESKLFENTGHGVTLLRIPNGGAEYTWLLRESAIRDTMADPEDGNFLIMEVVITPANLAIFKHRFGNLTISIESLKQ